MIPGRGMSLAGRLGVTLILEAVAWVGLLALVWWSS